MHEQKMHKNDAIVSFCVTDKMEIDQELTAGGKSRENQGCKVCSKAQRQIQEYFLDLSYLMTTVNQLLV